MDSASSKDVMTPISEPVCGNLSLAGHVATLGFFVLKAVISIKNALNLPRPAVLEDLQVYRPQSSLARKRLPRIVPPGDKCNLWSTSTDH